MLGHPISEANVAVIVFVALILEDQLEVKSPERKSINSLEENVFFFIVKIDSPVFHLISDRMVVVDPSQKINYQTMHGTVSAHARDPRPRQIFPEE